MLPVPASEASFLFLFCGDQFKLQYLICSHYVADYHEYDIKVLDYRKDYLYKYSMWIPGGVKLMLAKVKWGR